MSSARFTQLRLLLVASVTLLLFVTLASPLFATSFVSADAITIGKNEVIDDDLFISGNSVVIDGVVNGDLFAFGSNVTINGEVKGSLVMAGQLLAVNGTVGGSVYSGGAALTVGPDAQIGRNMHFGGYSYRTDSGSRIAMDTFVGGYQAALLGEVGRNLYASLGALELYGTVGGNVQAQVDKPDTAVPTQFFTGFGNQPLPPALDPGLRIGPEAQIGGQLRYSSPVEQANNIEMKPAGGVSYVAPQIATPTAPVVPPNPFLEWTFARIRELVTILFIGVMLLWLLPAAFHAITEHTMVEPIMAAAWGFLVTIVGYTSTVLLTIVLIMLVSGFVAMTLTGLATSVLALGVSALMLAFTIFSILVVYVSKVVVVYPLAQWLLERAVPNWGHNRWLPLFLGSFVYVLLRSIPWFGMLLAVVVTIVGLGSIWLAFRNRYMKPKPAPPALVLKPA